MKVPSKTSGRFGGVEMCVPDGGCGSGIFCVAIEPYVEMKCGRLFVCLR